MTDSSESSTAAESSHEIVSRARAVVPGGAQTGLRGEVYALADVAFERADGVTLTTVDGDEFTDYHLAFGPVVLGHGDPVVDAAAKDAVDAGVLYGAGTTELEVTVAERLADLLPSVEQVNFCNSGSEATYHAIRLARAYTGNETVLKFEGCYHGWHDYVGTSVHPPAECVGERYRESAGMLDAAVEKTVVVPFNDPGAFREAMAEHGDDLAAVILEPVPHSVGCLLPTDEFLAALDEETDRRGVPLVFDEVITAFRHALGGVQSTFDVTPDLTTMAKAMGNGYPVAAVGGRRDLLAQAGDDGDVVISGTYSGHPVGLAAAHATLDRIEETDAIPHVTQLGDRYRRGLRDLVADHGVDARVVGYRSVFSLQFGVAGEPRSYADVVGLDGDRFREYARGMFDHGQFFTPNPHKRHHLSAAHDEADLRRYLDAADEVLAGLAE